MKHSPLFMGSICLCLSLVALPNLTQASTPHAHSYLKVASSPGLTGYSPSQIRTAYAVSQVKQTGHGQTIAIVDAYDAPSIEHDLGVFNGQFNLSQLNASPGCVSACFTKLYATGSKPGTSAGWAQEISLDVEWAHAIAPQANILLVEAKDDSEDSLLQAVDVATAHGASVVSMSWGGPEATNEAALDTHFRSSGVVYVASAGDDGSKTSYPAASPYVLSVGGTTLKVSASGTRQGSETAWTGSGGGVSKYEDRPIFQKPFNPQTHRSIPDVSYDADPATGFAIYDSTKYQGESGWLMVGGTSAGAPQWASIIALAKEGGKLSTNGLASLYQANNALRDVVLGSNGGCGKTCSAGIGYDAVTGLGTPITGKLLSLVK